MAAGAAAPVEIVLHGASYRIGALPSMKRFHVLRRVLHIMPDFRSPDASARFTAMMATMSNDALDAIFLPCFGAVERHDGKRWVRLVRGNDLAFDLLPEEVVELAFAAIQVNVAAGRPAAPPQADHTELMTMQ